MEQDSKDYKNIKPKDVFKAWLVEGAKFLGKYELPKIKTCDKIPSKLISFDKTKNNKFYNKWVHFYLHDYKYECLWNNPKAYLNCLQNMKAL